MLGTSLVITVFQADFARVIFLYIRVLHLLDFIQGSGIATYVFTIEWSSAVNVFHMEVDVCALHVSNRDFILLIHLEIFPKPNAHFCAPLI